MQSRYAVLIATLLAGTSAFAAPDLPTYAVTDLKALGIWPVAMNNQGQVLGYSQAGDPVGPAPVYFRSFLYSAGDVTELFPPTDSPYSYPELLSDGGHVTLSANGGYWLYERGTYRKLSPPPPESPADRLAYWKVFSLNAAGEAAGSVSWYKEPPQEFETQVAWAWVDDHGLLKDLKPAGERGCRPAGTDAINAGGDVALECDTGVGVMYRDGTWRRIDEQPAYIRSFNDAASVLVFKPDYGGRTYVFTDGSTGVIEPVCPEDSANCQADGYDLSDRGEVVGSTYFVATVGSATRSLNRALIWRDGKTTDVHPAGALSSVLASINEGGVAVGFYDTQDGKPRPFVYSSDTNVDISELRGVGAALDAVLATSNQVSIRIADSGHILVAATWASFWPPEKWQYVRLGAYLLSPVVPTVSLSADTTQTRAGRPVVLTWNSTDANSCAASGGVSGDGWAGTRATSGQLTLTASVPSDVRYSMRCSAGPVYGDATVAVAYTRKSGGGGRLDALAALLLGCAGLGLSRRRKAN